jgi:zinc transport system substrate-binding protein
MDPLRVVDATSTVEAALRAVDPDGSEAHAANAAALREELTALDERIESLVADAGEGVLLVAGHNSFRYLGDRYGLTVEALTGLSPDDQPTTRDIERAQEVIKEHDVRYVCADPLESQRAADQLVAETDAEAVLPLTAMPGLTDEWAENDWGYLDVMREVNVPTLERALGR